MNIRLTMDRPSTLFLTRRAIFFGFPEAMTSASRDSLAIRYSHDVSFIQPPVKVIFAATAAVAREPGGSLYARATLPPKGGGLYNLFVSYPADRTEISMAAIKEKGAPRDKDKLIRQLSLVAYLMARQGRPVKADDIRRFVEGYDDGTRSQETFARRFYADRDELAHMGIAIESGHDEAGEGDSYWLPPENFFLPPVPFTREELAALHTCLYLLEGQFAYDRLLRLALQSLALGAGNPLGEPDTSFISVDMASAGFDAEVAGRQQKIDEAIAARKTIRFDYHNFAADRIEERLVDPYRMMYTHHDWYLVGYSHERQAIRMFKLRRIRGRITYRDKKDHNFDTPEDFNVEDYLNLEPWQLGPPRGTARIEFSSRYGRCAANSLSGSGEFELHDDGSATFQTSYADSRQLCSMVLSRSADSLLVDPLELREEMAVILENIGRLHEGTAPKPAPALESQPERHASPEGGGPQPHVEPERFSQLAKTVAYLEARLNGGEFVTLPVDEVCRDLGFDRVHLEQAMSMLFLVSAESGGYLVNGTIEGDQLHVEGFPHGEMLRKPVRLTPREARAMLLAIDLVGGRILAGQNQSLEKAREKIILAAGGLQDFETIPIGEASREDLDISSAVNRGLAERRLVEIEYHSHSGGVPSGGPSGGVPSGGGPPGGVPGDNGSEGDGKRVIEPYLVYGTKGRWYLVAWCRKRQGVRTFRFEMVSSARLLDETFEDRDIDLEVYRRNPLTPSGKEAPGLASVLFSPAVARWVFEMQPGTVMLDDSSLLAGIPWFNEDWIVDEVLRHCGEAVVVAPETLRERVRETALRLAAEYR